MNRKLTVEVEMELDDECVIDDESMVGVFMSMLDYESLIAFYGVCGITVRYGDSDSDAW